TITLHLNCPRHLILVAMILSMVVNGKFFLNMGQVKKSLVLSMWAIYIIAEGAGFGILFTAFYAQFGLSKGVSYLLLIFAAGGVAFLICALIGKSLSTKQMISFGKFVGYMSIGFMIVFAMCMLAMMITLFIPGAGGWMGGGMWTLIIGLSTLLFLFYTIFDVSMISKTQQFIATDDRNIVWNIGMIFGFRLLVDLVGLIWNIAILVLRYVR
ncbi:MAG: hypothetical protein LBT17_01410, partial [Mycoplasmataceae bacterium]|nr:hypothetical protein [Mycoplasmataceae bacterium]